MDDSRQGGRASARTAVTRLEFEMDWPPGHVAAYLIEADDPILVDAGIPEETGADAMRAALADAGYEPSDLAAVVITHPHTDHIGQARLFHDAGVDVYAPSAVLDQLRRSDDLAQNVRDVAESAGLDRERATAQAERAVESLQRNRRLLDPDDTIGFGFDDPVTVAGREFEPVHTPGHQINHAALATTIDDESVLFSGDALIETFRAAALDVGLDHGVYDSIDHFYQSMDRLENRGFDHVYPGHGPEFADAPDVIAETRTALDRLVAATRETVAEIGPVAPVEIVHHRFGEVDHPAHLLDTLGALGTLGARGEVRYDVEDGVRIYERP